MESMKNFLKRWEGNEEGGKNKFSSKYIPIQKSIFLHIIIAWGDTWPFD